MRLSPEISQKIIDIDTEPLSKEDKVAKEIAIVDLWILTEEYVILNPELAKEDLKYYQDNEAEDRYLKLKEVMLKLGI